MRFRKKPVEIEAMQQAVTLIKCPDCGLLASALFMAQTDHAGWTEWRCWRCDHVFGGFHDGGELDIGLVRDTELNTNDLNVFHERWGSG